MRRSFPIEDMNMIIINLATNTQKGDERIPYRQTDSSYFYSERVQAEILPDIQIATESSFSIYSTHPLQMVKTMTHAQKVSSIATAASWKIPCE